MAFHCNNGAQGVLLPVVKQMYVEERLLLSLKKKGTSFHILLTSAPNLAPLTKDSYSSLQRYHRLFLPIFYFYFFGKGVSSSIKKIRYKHFFLEPTIQTLFFFFEIPTILLIFFASWAANFFPLGFGGPKGRCDPAHEQNLARGTRTGGLWTQSHHRSGAREPQRAERVRESRSRRSHGNHSLVIFSPLPRSSGQR